MNEVEYSKSSRILYLYSELLNDGLVKKREEAIRFHVTEKSIQRDLDEIRNFLDAQTAEEGFRDYLVYDYKEKGYRLERQIRSVMTNDEILAVSKILLASRAFTKKEMMGLLDKLLAGCVPQKNQDLINALLSNERYHYIEPQHGKVFLDKMMVLGEAIRDTFVLRIRYRRTTDKTVVERRIEPLAILFSEFYFYLTAFIEEIDKGYFENANDPYPTIYRIDRIEGIEKLDERFRIPYSDRFEEGEFRKRIQFMQGGRLQRIKFVYAGESVEAVLDRLPTARILSEQDGAYTIQAEVFGKGIEMWVRSQGERIRDYTVREL